MQKQKVILHTDGVDGFKSVGPQRIAFGYNRLVEVIRLNATKDLNGIVQAIEQSFADYSGIESRRDDLTVLAFQPITEKSLIRALVASESTVYPSVR